MRKIFFLLILFILFLFSFSGNLWAADSLIGTWKTNLEKSIIPAGPKAIKEDTNTYCEIDGDLIELTIKTVYEDDSVYLVKYTWPKQGGFAKSLTKTLPEGFLYVQVLVEPGFWTTSLTQDGVQVGRYHKVVSKDGKTMRQTFKSTKDGKSVYMMKVLERQ